MHTKLFVHYTRWIPGLTKIIVGLEDEGSLGGVQSEVGLDGIHVVVAVGETDGVGLDALHFSLHRHLLHWAHHLHKHNVQILFTICTNTTSKCCSPSAETQRPNAIHHLQKHNVQMLFTICRNTTFGYCSPSAGRQRLNTVHHLQKHNVQILFTICRNTTFK